MSASWTPLLPMAMVGTDRQGSNLPVWPGDVGEVIAQAMSASSDAATGVLRAAAVLAACDLAGAQGSPWLEPLPAPAPDELLPALTDGTLLTGVAWALHDGPPRLQHEVCIALARARWRLPSALLPQLLELGRRSVALRPRILPVLGERGLWLAAQRDDWRYAAGVSGGTVDESRWIDGSFEQRREFLQLERAADPRAARERLARSLVELPHKERAELVGVLAHGLSLDDEAMLDTLRADRSREVRQAALDLLLRLQQGAHTQRAIARIDALLTHERVLLRKRWLIDAPTAAATDWKADNVDAARPKNEPLGERGWWLYQLVRQVPLAWWTDRTGMDAAELRQWANGTDWSEALLRGWRDVLFAAPDDAWCEAFLNQPQDTLRHDPAGILALLPLAARERHWQRQLRDAGAQLYVLIFQMLGACPPGETLSAELSAALADVVRQRVETRTAGEDYNLRAVLPELCCALHVGALDRLATLPRRPDETPAYADTLHAVTQVISVRRALHSLPTSRTP